MKKTMSLILVIIMTAALCSCAHSEGKIESSEDSSETSALVTTHTTKETKASETTKKETTQKETTETEPLETEAPVTDVLTSTTLENYPKVDGSTATIPLAIALIQKMTGCSEIKAEEYINFSTTDPSYHALAEGNVDLLLVYEPSQPTIDELDVFDTMDMREIGLDALVFIVNEDNPINSLTSDQIRGIYSGAITNWSEVGGDDIEIIPFQRPVLSGSQTLMLNLMMKNTAIMEPETEVLVSGEMGDLIEDIAAYKNSANAIGYSVYYYAKNMYTQPGLKFIAVDDVAPSNTTINSREYGYINPFYGIIALNADPRAEAILDWLLTEDGQKLLEDCGYVPIVKID
jgi:ABC-type phosphate transport system substrate-binding protein